MKTGLEKRYCSIKELSKYTGIPATTLYDWASLRVIPSIKIRKRILFDINDIDEVMDKLKREEVNHDEKAEEITSAVKGHV